MCINIIYPGRSINLICTAKILCCGELYDAKSVVGCFCVVIIEGVVFFVRVKLFFFTSQEKIKGFLANNNV